MRSEVCPKSGFNPPYDHTVESNTNTKVTTVLQYCGYSKEVMLKYYD